MNAEDSEKMSALAQDLRREFDERFASPPVMTSPATEEFVLMRAGSSLFALSVGDFSRLLRCPKITPLPSENRAILGLVGTLGSLSAVYDAGVLFGTTEVTASGAWLLTLKCDPSCALLFSASDGYRAVSAADIVSSESGESLRQLTRGFFHNGQIAHVVERSHLPALQKNSRHPS